RSCFLRAAMRHLPVSLVAPVLVIAAAACKDDPPPAPVTHASATVAASAAAGAHASASASASAAAEASATASAPLPPPLTPPPRRSSPRPRAAPLACKINAQKSWARGTTTPPGLTEFELSDGRVAIGFATGLDPQVLVIGKKGEGTVYKVPSKPGTTLATPP